MLSVIIPNHNGARTIDRCLDHVLASDHDDFEVIVVDDASTDDSVCRAGKYPCRLMCMTEHGGASRARNLGAACARGDILLFIDVDCLVQSDTLRVAETASRRHGYNTVVGGTYTRQPADPGFFNAFQSIFIHHCETRHRDSPDYVAGHAMVIQARTFGEHGGFPERFLPILEDVEFSHRLRRRGVRLVMEPGLTVRHIFNFNLFRSQVNAVRKTRYWVLYSLSNGDMLADSGTASRPLKVNAVVLVLSVFLLLAGLVLQLPQTIMVAVFLQLGNMVAQKSLFTDFRSSGGPVFALTAVLYYMFIYPWAIMLGGLCGVGNYYLHRLLWSRKPAGGEENHMPISCVHSVRPPFEHNASLGKPSLALKSSETA